MISQKQLEAHAKTIEHLRHPPFHPLVTEGLKWYGTYEFKGADVDNPVILSWARTMELYFRDNGDDYRADQCKSYQHDAEEWCTLGISWCCWSLGYTVPRALKWSQAYAKWYEPVLGRPQPGDLGVTWRPDPKKVLPDRALGHVFIVVDSSYKGFVEALGFNQSDAVNIKTIRVDETRLVGFRRLTDAWRRPDGTRPT